MSTAYKCDCCGRYYDEQKMEKSGKRIFGNYSLEFVFNPNIKDIKPIEETNVDICEECKSKIEDFIGILGRINEEDKEFNYSCFGKFDRNYLSCLHCSKYLKCKEETNGK